MALLYYHLTIISSFVLWGCQILYNINKLIKQYEYQERKELVNMDIILKSILRPQIPFLIGGTITGTIMITTMDFLLQS
jgi:hypothetical protein